jgi:mycoredoxin
VTQDQVTVYWRPRCPYCIRLRWQLRWAKLPVRAVNIWQDPAAAALVREITGGDETVPTVVIGELAMVNPSRAQVLAAVRAADR